MVARPAIALTTLLLAGSTFAQVLPAFGGGGGATTFANPTGTVGATAVNGSAATAMRSDAAPALAAGAALANLGANSVTPALMSQAGANTLRGNPTGSTANVQDVEIPATCNGVGQSLSYNGAAFSCAYKSGAMFLAGVRNAANGGQVDMSSTLDQAISLNGPATGSWEVTRLVITNCAASPGAAAGGIYGSTGGTGGLIFASSAVTYNGLTSPNNAKIFTSNSSNGSAYYQITQTTSTQSIYLKLSTAGSSSCDMYVYGEVL